MSQNETAAPARHARKTRLKALAVRPALIALAAAGMIAGSAGLAAASTLTVYSGAWSGYAATNGTYTSVSASWVLPTLASCSASSTQDARFWVGLDGYSDATLERIGIDGVCEDGATAYQAWYEMPPLTYWLSYDPRPGDHISASVTYKGSNVFSLYIADTTQGWGRTVTATLAGAPRSSAEVIVEDPVGSSGSNLPLTDFGTVNFTGATVNGSALGNAGGLTAINLIDSEGQSMDTISALSGGENFSATWRRSS